MAPQPTAPTGSPTTQTGSAAAPRRGPVIVVVIVALLVVAVAAVIALGAPDETAVVRTEVAAVEVDGETLPLLGAPGERDGAVGMAAPVLSGSDFDGNPVRIEPGQGRPMLLVFGAHWCPHCQREFPVLATWMANGKKPANLDVVAITTATDPAAPNYPPSAWLETIDWSAGVMVDSAENAAQTAYGVSGFPFMVVVDADGSVVARVAGELAPGEIDVLVGLVA